MAETIETLISEEDVDKRIAELGRDIDSDLNGEPVVIVCLLRGASFFACELAKRITNSPVTIDFMYVSSYGNGTESSGNIKISKDIDVDVTGKNVLIAEDIIDSGNTLHYVRRNFENRGAKAVRIATLLSKPDRRKVEVPVEYNGFIIPDKFVVGYGLDYAQKYRNLPYIGVVNFDE